MDSAARQRPRVVLANGCFDPFHYGHAIHLVEASQLGDRLLVAVTSDEALEQEKGRKPHFSQKHRCYVLAENRRVDFVFSVDGVMEALQRAKPDVFVKGPDYRGKISREVLEYCNAEHIEIRFTNGPKWSSTELMNELRRN